MKSILIRCDASLLIGSGHVMRCRTLARDLQRRGAEVIFLCRRQPGDLINLLQSEFAVLALPEQTLSTCDGLDGRDLYSSWLGCSQQLDAAQCLEVLALAGITSASWLVVDHYGLDASWEMQLLSGLASGKKPPELLAIDDLADRPHQADYLLDQNFFGSITESRYAQLVPDYCQKLLGPHYALLASEYALLHPLVPSRHELKRILVYFGGVDPLNLTRLSLEVLSDVQFKNLAVDVVVGQLDGDYETISKLASYRPNTTIHNSLPSLAALITRADLSIGAGGATTWERSCLRLPSIVLPVASNQDRCINALHEEGYILQVAINIDTFSEKLKHIFLDFQQNYPEVCSRFGRPLTDGLGTQRLAEKMIGEARKGQ